MLPVEEKAILSCVVLVVEAGKASESGAVDADISSSIRARFDGGAS